MQHITWELMYRSAPRVVKYCKNCGEKTYYESSGLFRVNAQKKSLDIWMIYRCETCDNTWNAEIYSRISPGRLSEEVLERFHRNDPVLAQDYAMNTEWLKRLQAEFVLPDYEVKGELPADSQLTAVRILNPYALPYKAAAVIRKKLLLSQRGWFRLVDLGVIAGEKGEDLKKARLASDCILIINRSGDSY